MFRCVSFWRLRKLLRKYDPASTPFPDESTQRVFDFYNAVAAIVNRTA